LAAIEFNDQFRLAAGEVGDVRTDRALPHDLEPAEPPVAQA
jgi:hypothetical protein